MAKKKGANLLPKLTEAEHDLLSHIQNGYQLETDSLGGNPVLRRLKDNEEVRPMSANRNTIKAMERRGIISPGNMMEVLHREHALSDMFVAYLLTRNIRYEEDLVD